MAPRKITADERALVGRLLSARSLPDKTIRIAEDVEQIDKEGSLRFRHSRTPSKIEQEKYSVEAQFEDADGILIHALLFLVDDEVDELEFYKDDSSPILRGPTAQEWEIIDLS